jgi:hypothetical protein
VATAFTWSLPRERVRIVPILAVLTIHALCEEGRVGHIREFRRQPLGHS